ncbi:hypothetical protein BCR34DRAFT_219572 [Clohesyomyces aquaticus]|uniref:Uncharacterized protein n=1 Tax=Clohesyomyces aquaticus TaxID=1231657 RepID=A0A1Y1YAC9_9PLEO|nr:hypothetical protein BCR34DRAFT_219572 [Clohesyomyces aquaticus]
MYSSQPLSRMTSSKVSPVAPTLPSKLQLAFAIAVVRYKSEDTSVRDHILQLRQHLRHGKAVFPSKDGHRHFDSVSYWKEQCAAVQQNCQELERRNMQLERANDHLQRLTVGPGDEATTVTKRKRGGGSKQAPGKRAKASTASSDQAIADAEDTLTGDLEILDRVGEGTKHCLLLTIFLTFGVAGSTLTLNLYNVHKLCRHQSPDNQAICFSLVHTARAIGSVISTVSRHQNQLTLSYKRASTPLEKDKSEMSCVIRASARAFTSLLVGLGKLVLGDIEGRLSGPVIYETVKMFKKVLDVMTDTARSAASKSSASVSNQTSSRTKPPAKNKETVQCRTIAQFLNAIMSYLDKNDPVHRHMFEGFLFILFERVSSRLYYCTFGHDPKLLADQEHILDPDSIPKKDGADLPVQLEIPSLINVFERALSLAPHHLNSRPSSSTSKSQKSRSASTARYLAYKGLPLDRKMPLSIQAKERLQRTLVQCMWNEEEDDEFADVLRMPVRWGSLPNAPKIGDRDVTDWFKGEVFRLVGWDILKHESVM